MDQQTKRQTMDRGDYNGPCHGHVDNLPLSRLLLVYTVVHVDRIDLIRDIDITNCT